MQTVQALTPRDLAALRRLHALLGAFLNNTEAAPRKRQPRLTPKRVRLGKTLDTVPA